MAENNLKKQSAQRRQELADRIKEINSKMPALVADIRKKIDIKRKPRPGMVFFATAPPSDRKGEQETTPSVMLLRREGKGLWTCCKISIETSYLGPFDLLLDPDEWSGGFPLLLETWNTVSLHEDDMNGDFYDDVTCELVKKAEELFCAYQQSGMIPEHLRHDTGRVLEEGDIRLQFRSREMGTMERVRMHYHEGWKGFAKELKEKVKKFVQSFTVTLIPFPLEASDTSIHLDLDKKKHTPLLEDDFISIVISQELDMVYLRIYPEVNGLWPDEIRIRNEVIKVEEKGGCIEARLGIMRLLPEKIDITVAVQERLYQLHVSFNKGTDET